MKSNAKKLGEFTSIYKAFIQINKNTKINQIIMEITKIERRKYILHNIFLIILFLQLC